MSFQQHTQLSTPRTLKLDNTARQFSNKATSIKTTKLKTPTSTLKQSTLKSPGSHKKRNFNSVCRFPRPNIELEDGLGSILVQIFTLNTFAIIQFKGLTFIIYIFLNIIL